MLASQPNIGMNKTVSKQSLSKKAKLDTPKFEQFKYGQKKTRVSAEFPRHAHSEDSDDGRPSSGLKKRKQQPTFRDKSSASSLGRSASNPR
mmetsp:Transcript_5003/g.7485  ORF Transcript_5003/g.7485 Transcript_5003/m.7485 type:complete len:91 (+) Transcript_5003:878-1150(+)